MIEACWRCHLTAASHVLLVKHWSTDELSWWRQPYRPAVSRLACSSSKLEMVRRRNRCSLLQYHPSSSIEPWLAACVTLFFFLLVWYALPGIFDRMASRSQRPTDRESISVFLRPARKRFGPVCWAAVILSLPGGYGLTYICAPSLIHRQE